MGGGYLSVSFTVANFIFLYLFKKSISIERKQYDLFLNMLLIEVLIGMGAAFMEQIHLDYFVFASIWILLTY